MKIFIHSKQLEKAFSNTGRRTELIRHGEDEATIYIETDTGLEIDRKIKRRKSRLFQIKTTRLKNKIDRKQLRKFIKGVFLDL